MDNSHIDRLMDYYNVNSMEELITQMEEHINRLQKALQDMEENEEDMRKERVFNDN